jgi:hypothetical protein
VDCIVLPVSLLLPSHCLLHIINASRLLLETKEEMFLSVGGALSLLSEAVFSSGLPPMLLLVVSVTLLGREEESPHK